MIWIILIIMAIIFIAIKKHTKALRLSDITLVSGGVKTGKSTLSVYLALRSYRRSLWLWKFRTAMLRRKEEKPLLYSNIPLKCPYVPLTKDLLERKARFARGSVVYICEASLIADSMLYKDAMLNEELQLFCKLFGHSCKGGKMYLDTQCINDMHFGFKRVINSYLWIHSTLKLPFFLLMRVRELKYSNDENTINCFNEDVDESTRLLLVPKSVWKKFDAWAYSVLTDNKPLVDNEVIADSLKANDIVSFKEFKTIGVKENEKI